MVDLPRTRLDVVSPGAQSSVSPGYVKSAFSELARGLESLGNTLGEQQMQQEQAQARVEGENAVYRDTQGNLTFNPRPLDRTGRAYNDAAMSAYLARQHPESMMQMTQAAANANGNVAALDTWYKGYKTQMLKGKPPIIAGPLETLLDQQYGAQREGMIRRQDAIDVRSQEQSLRQSIELSNQDATELAASGGTDTPEYKSKLADITSQLNQLESNPLFGFTKAQGDVMLRRMEEAHTGEMVVGQVKRIFDTQGLSAAQDYLKHFDDPSLNMSPAARRRYQNIAVGALREAKAANVEDYKAAQSAAGIMKEGFKDGLPFKDDDVFSLAQRLSSTGGANGAVEAMDLLRRANIAKFNQSFSKLSDKEQADQMGKMIAPATPSGSAPGAAGYGAINAPYHAPLQQKGEKGIVSPAEHFSYLKSIGASTNEALMLTGAAANESSFNATAVHDQGRGYGLYGHSLARLDLRGQSWQAQAAAALQELRRRPESALVNSAKSPEDLALAEMHFEQPRGYTAANPKGGDNYTGRLNTLRYFSQMANGVVSGAQGAIVGTPRSSQPRSDVTMSLSAPSQAQGIDPAIYHSMQKEVASDAHRLWDGMQAGLKKGEIPSVDDMNLLGQQLGLIGDQDFTNKVRSFFSSGIAAAPRESIDALNAGIAQMEKDGISATNRDAYEGMVAIRDKTVQEFSSADGDPYQMAVGRGVVPAPHNLDFSTPLSTQSAIADRIQGSQRISGVYGVGAVTAFSKADALTFNNAVASGNPQQTANALQSLSLLPPDILTKTLAMPEVKQAITGAINSRNFPLWDQAMRAVDQAYAKAPGEVERTLGKEAIDQLQDWQGKLRYYSPVQMQDYFNKMNDPSFAKQQKQLLEDGHQVARDEAVKDFGGNIIGHRVNVPDAVKRIVGPTWTGVPEPIDPQTLNAFRSDYEGVFAERFASLQDRDQARAQTDQRLANVWGTSAANNGRFMLYPPEKFVHDVNGSKDWMQPQLEQALTDLGYRQHVTDPSGIYSTATDVVMPHTLVADAVTQSQIDSGKGPITYRVLVNDPVKGWDVMRDLNGNEQRFYFDETMVPIDRTRYERGREGLSRIGQEPKLFGAGPIGPSGEQPSAPPAEPAPVEPTPIPPVPFEPQPKGPPAPRPGSLKTLRP